MPAPLIRPRFTYADLCALPADGKRYALHEGEIVVSPSPSLAHQRLVRVLLLRLAAACPADVEIVPSPMDVVLADDTVLQPDLLLVSAARRSILQDVVRGAPDAVIEVLSPSTRLLDRNLKLTLYARHGVDTCWLVDPQTRTVECYQRDAQEGAFRREATLDATATLTTPLLPALRLDVAALFADALGDA
ncbi:MAG: Uma2 family endonuclease [Acidobacteriota bacterium]